MSILIKGMEMPTSPVLFCIYPDGKVFADLEGNWREYKAVPVPPHGRLGDLDALKVSLVFAEETAKWAVPALRAVLMVIDEMPTIIPASEEEMK